MERGIPLLFDLSQNCENFSTFTHLLAFETVLMPVLDINFVNAEYFV